MDRHMEADYDRHCNEQATMDDLWEEHCLAIREGIREGNLTCVYEWKGKAVPFETEFEQYFQKGEANQLVQHIVKGEGEQALALLREVVGRSLEGLYNTTWDARRL